MSLISADRIHNGERWLPQGACIQVSESGIIEAIHEFGAEEATHYEGWLMPGLVNAHCHLELSHMKELIPEHTGLVPFLQSVPRYRNDFTDEQKKAARHAGYNELLANGVVAVGDICNTADALDLRDLDEMHYYSFVESIGFLDARAEKSFGYALETLDKYEAQKAGKHLLKQGIVPHAPYSVSRTLFGLIEGHCDGGILSIHNQESDDENNFYKNKTGNICELLSTLNIDCSAFEPTGKSSLESIIGWLSRKNNMMLVHNVVTTPEEMQAAMNHFETVYWCLCPNANLYIQNRLPDVSMLIASGATICIGTDSLASNHQLNIIEELRTLKRYFAALEWEQLIGWATSEGAKALQMNDVIGTIAAGKCPGIVQVVGMEDLECVPRIMRVV